MGGSVSEVNDINFLLKKINIKKRIAQGNAHKFVCVFLTYIKTRVVSLTSIILV